ncbi:MAG: anti-sigma factor antagonist [Miltoncostaeaceae bacterium]|jgi:anti-sigma B factor antagonist|nr:anti-sigma factor antagonist [Miltoncostaeaceae bacterium]
MSEPLARVMAEHRGDVRLVAVAGEVDLSNAVALEVEILRHTKDGGGVALDLSEVGFMDSAGVALLQRLARTLVKSGRSLRLVAQASSPVGRLVGMTGLEGLIPRDETVEEALAALS